MRSVLILSVSAFALAAVAHPSAAQPPPHEPLAGTAWQLVKFQGGDGAVKTPDDRSKYTITFTADGRVSVRFDCNRGNGRWKGTPPELLFGPLALTGTYELTGDDVTFGPMAATKMACLGTAAIERGFQAAIQRAKRVEVSGDRLELVDAAGAKLAVFEARPR